MKWKVRNEAVVTLELSCGELLQLLRESGHCNDADSHIPVLGELSHQISIPGNTQALYSALYAAAADVGLVEHDEFTSNPADEDDELPL